MSYNLKLDAEDDIIIGRGAERVEGVEYIVQLVKCRLTTILGEWDLDESIGIDWFNIMGANADLSIIQGIVTQTIRDTRGVDSLTSIDLNVDRATRKLTIDFAGVALGEVFTETITT